MSIVFHSTTRNIRVMVEPHYLEEASRPEDEFFAWSYQVTLQNKGQETVQLLTRHWVITDARGLTQRVNGAGVIGEQPTLRSGEKYSYASWTQLSTNSGLMHGHYGMMTDAGEPFMITIPSFSLDSPQTLQRAN
jgi:ApaG protein